MKKTVYALLVTIFFILNNFAQSKLKFGVNGGL